MVLYQQLEQLTGSMQWLIIQTEQLRLNGRHGITEKLELDITTLKLEAIYGSLMVWTFQLFMVQVIWFLKISQLWLNN